MKEKFDNSLEMANHRGGNYDQIWWTIAFRHFVYDDLLENSHLWNFHSFDKMWLAKFCCMWWQNKTFFFRNSTNFCLVGLTHMRLNKRKKRIKKLPTETDNDLKFTRLVMRDFYRKKKWVEYEMKSDPFFFFFWLLLLNDFSNLEYHTRMRTCRLKFKFESFFGKVTWVHGCWLFSKAIEKKKTRRRRKFRFGIFGL